MRRHKAIVFLWRVLEANRYTHGYTIISYENFKNKGCFGYFTGKSCILLHLILFRYYYGFVLRIRMCLLFIYSTYIYIYYNRILCYIMYECTKYVYKKKFILMQLHFRQGGETYGGIFRQY